MGRMEPISTGVPHGKGPVDVVVTGASTGGPPAVERILAALPRRFRVPVVICQHMPPGFTQLWAERLDHVSKLTVREAVDREVLEPGRAYVAPIGMQARLERGPQGRRVRLFEDFADSLHVPSIDILMSSVAECYGSLSLGVLLTGLGADGALGMLSLRRAGGHTIAQDEATSQAYPMPGSAVELGAVAESMPLERIADRVMELAEL